jgi:hypothetical protein
VANPVEESCGGFGELDGVMDQHAIFRSASICLFAALLLNSLGCRHDGCE